MVPNGHDFERSNPVMAKSFKTLTSEMSPDTKEHVNQRVRGALLESTLEELCQNASDISQNELKELLESTQDAILQLAGRKDPLLGDLAKSIKALGGGLELVARFPDANVRITQFDENDDPSSLRRHHQLANELVHLLDGEELLLHPRSLEISADGAARLRGELVGEQIVRPRHVLLSDVKAATAHGLSLVRRDDGWLASATLAVSREIGEAVSDRAG